MKMTVRTEVLERALYRVQGIADKKSTMPILAHVLLRAGGDAGPNSLTVTATDMDVGLSGTYEAEVKAPGSAAVHARQLYEIVKAMPGSQIDFSLQENKWVELKSGNSRFKLVGMPAEDFPALPSHGHAKLFSVPAESLVQMIDRTLFCVSTDDNRHNLSGIFCEAPKAKMLRMVATDGHRLALAERNFDQPITIERGVIVPRKGFQELRRVLSDSHEKIEHVQLGFSGNSGIMKAGNVELSTRLVEGQFPDYEQVIPQAGSRTAKIPRVAFSEALKRVSLLSASRAWGVRMAFAAGKVELIAEDPEQGQASELLEIDYSGDSLAIGFNARYVLDVLALVRDDVIRFDLLDDLSPGVIRPLDEQGFVAVVMPMRI